MKDHPHSPEEKRRARLRSRLRVGSGRFSPVHEISGNRRDFRCANCGRLVSTDPLLSGVQNRNHCPYCLWSRHLDLYQAGDRLAACKAPMQPVGLALKRVHKRYASPVAGELMLIHLCLECGRVSLNRIAADDDAETVVAAFKAAAIPDAHLAERLEKGSIIPLQAADAALIEAQLFGVLTQA